MSRTVFRRRYWFVRILMALAIVMPVSVLAGTSSSRLYLQADDTTEASNAKPQTDPPIEGMRKTQCHFKIEYGGQVNDMESVMEWIYLRHNWLVLDPSRALEDDAGIYASVAQAAEWARLLATDPQWSPEGLRTEADDNDELRHLSARADVANAIVRFCSRALVVLLLGPRASATTEGAKKIAELISDAVNTSEEISKTWLTAKARDRLFMGQRGEALRPSGIYYLIKRYAYEARLSEVTPHTLRHTFGKNLIDAGVPLDRVAQFLGHSRVDTTRIYTTPSEQDLQNARCLNLRSLVSGVTNSLAKVLTLFCGAVVETSPRYTPFLPSLYEG